MESKSVVAWCIIMSYYITIISSLRQHPFIISCFLWVKSLGTGSSTRLQSRRWPGMGSHLRPDWGKDQVPSSCSYCFIQLLAGFLSGFGLEAALSSLPHGPLHVAAHKLAGCFLKASKGEIRWTLQSMYTITYILSPWPYSVC